MTNFQEYLRLLQRGSYKEAESIYLLADREEFTFPESIEQWQPTRPYFINHLKMIWKVNLEQATIIAVNEMTITSKVANLTSINLHAVNIGIVKISDQIGNNLSFNSNNDEHSLIIKLKDGLNEGEKVVFTISYEVHQPCTGGFFEKPNANFPDNGYQFWTQFQDNYSRFLIPIYDHPSHKFPVEMIVTVPNGYYAISNGVLKERKQNKDKTETFHWFQEKPIPAYLITLAIGDFNVYVEKLGELDVIYYAEKKWDKETVYRSLGKTPKMIDFFNKKFGVKYPWDKYGQVVVSNFVMGGMENVSVTTLTDNMFHDEKTHKDYTSDGLVAHELVHQWIGDLITCKSWSHGWINEGGATQLQNEWKKHDLGLDEYLYEQLGKQESYFDEDKNKYRRPLVQRKWEWGFDVFDAHLYPGAAWRYYMLKHLVGEEVWWKVLGHILTKHAYTNVETIDYQRAFEDITGNDYDWFFDQWLIKAGYPEVTIKVNYDAEIKKVMVKIEQTQNHADTPKEFRFPFVVKVTNNDGSQNRFEETVTQRIHTFYFSVNDSPKMIEIDPDYTVLMDASIEKPIEMWIHQLTNGANIISRIKAARALGKKATQMAVKSLNDALTSESFWGVKVEIAKVLGKLKTELALEGLLSAVNLKDSRARSAVATALGNFYQNEKAHKALVSMLSDKDSYFVISQAATSIGKVKLEEALDVLMKNIPSKDTSYLSIITRGFVNGLSALEKLEVLEKILPYTEVGVSDFIRREAITALGKLGKKFKKEHPEIKEYLVKTLLNDNSKRVQYSALAAIKGFGDASLIGTIQQFENMTCLTHYKRAAKVAIRSLSKEKDDGDLKTLQKTVEEIQKDNQELKDRIARLEAMKENEK
ncbi:MAG: HEAT repeat domain-containing protein [Candidatus Heimdallarchaeota archaeon]|nr:HEAT repeat domain-containing protein [Candidatus Heimdallarchaeota archaeon]